MATENGVQAAPLRVVKAPEAATWDQDTREFSWTPSEDDGPGEYDVIVQVGQGEFVVEASFRIIVTEEDSRPEFTPIETVTAKPLEEIQTSVKAVDPDVPGSQITYSLVQSESDLAAAASIDPESGAFSFTPPEKAAGETVAFKVNATELSDAGLHAEYEFRVHVSRFEDPVRQFRVELKKHDIPARVTEAPVDASTPFSGEVTHLEIDGHPVDVYR